MSSLQLNAEIYKALSIIAQDESLLKKAAKALKRIATKNTEDSVMTKEEFFVQIDEARKQIEEGHFKKMLKEENIDDFLTRNGYV